MPKVASAATPGTVPCQRQGGRSHPRTRAFTLFELTLVVVLIAIMVLMILPDMRGTYEEELLRASSRELLQALQLASSQAVAVQHRHQLRFDAAQNRFQVERMARADEEGPGFLPLKDLPGCQGKVDKRVTVRLQPVEGGSPYFIPDPEIEESSDSDAQNQTSSDANVLGFYPDGTADSREIILRDRAGFALALRVNPITGRVDLFNPARPPEP